MTDPCRDYVRVNWPKLISMVGQHDRPQQVLDFVDFIWKLIYGEVLR
jgi:hypothetical protein